MSPERRAGGAGLALLLTLLVALGPVSTDLYLPSLPGIAADLHASAAQTQLTIGLFIGGFAAMMLVCGPLADRFGRRPVLLAGMTIYVLASIACALSPTIRLLLAARFVQALGACVGPVLGRAIVRDLYEPARGRPHPRLHGERHGARPADRPLHRRLARGRLRLARQFLGPHRRSAWCSLACSPGASRRPCPNARPASRCPASLANYALILQNRTFLGFMLCVVFTFGALFTWISNSAFVVIDYFGVPPERFAWAFGAVIAGFVLGGYGGSRTGMRLGLGRATGIGCRSAPPPASRWHSAAGPAMGGLYAIVLLMALCFIGVGFVAPQATAGALAPFPHLAGTAAALLGFLQMSTGLLVNALTSATFDGTPRPMVTVNLTCALLALAAWWLLLRRQTRPRLSPTWMIGGSQVT